VLYKQIIKKKSNKVIMNILILGGCGYVGTVLAEKLINNKKNNIKIIDTEWFGNYVKKNKRIKFIKEDIRNIKKISFNQIDTIIHLANIANDPAVELNPLLSWEINVLSAKFIIEKAIKSKVQRVIFASSGSVYGIKKEKKVNEDLDLNPISTYNKTKMIAERVLMSYKDKIKVFCIRPATVCGLSPRMRFDLTVNMLTLQALKSKKIIVHGGSQIRPNIHINDLVRVFEHFLFEKNIKPGIYNAGFENMSVIKIAQLIQKIIPSKIILSKIKDIRSYRLDSSKIIKTGFKPKFKVIDAVLKIKKKFDENKLKIRENNFSVDWLKKILKYDKISL
jgi:nucleoside-diphosphate-sugar epimerase